MAYYEIDNLDSGSFYCSEDSMKRPNFDEFLSAI
jgi:hypothetical protein